VRPVTSTLLNPYKKAFESTPVMPMIMADLRRNERLGRWGPWCPDAGVVDIVSRLVAKANLFKNCRPRFYMAPLPFNSINCRTSNGKVRSLTGPDAGKKKGRKKKKNTERLQPICR